MTQKIEKKSSCDFEKDIWKLLNNSFYGKNNGKPKKQNECKIFK